MIEVFICEDNIKYRVRLTRVIEDYIQFDSVDMRVTLSTGDPNEIIEYIKEHAGTRLYFLDVNLKCEKTGIDLAAEIRKYDKRCALVFITNHPESMPLTFTHRVEAMDYIVKGDFESERSKVIECIQLAKERLIDDRSKKIFQIKSGDKIIQEDYDNILFFRQIPNTKQIVLHALNRRIPIHASLKDIEMFDECLYRCHRSYVVNKNNIKEIDKKSNEILMLNGEFCYMSSRLKGKFLREITEVL